MSKPVSELEIRTMVDLYSKYHSFAAVGRKMKIGANTVSKYIKQYQLTKKAQKNKLECNIELPKWVAPPDNWANLIQLSEEERTNLIELQTHILL